MNLAEGVQVVSFGVLAVLAIAAALGVVLLNNIVYSAFLLGGVFISVAGMYILLNAGFVAAAQVLIYVGAINVLILFAIMLVNKREEFNPIPRAWIRKAATGAVCLGLFALLSTMVLATPWSLATGAFASASRRPIAGDAATVIIGQHFFSDFLLPFELASVLLLMALIGAIVLARREYLPDEQPAETAVPPALTLPERPRELASVSDSASQR